MDLAAPAGSRCFTRSSVRRKGPAASLLNTEIEHSDGHFEGCRTQTVLLLASEIRKAEARGHVQKYDHHRFISPDKPDS